MKRIIYCGMLLTLLAQTACKKDYVNPNAATDAQVFGSSQSLTGVAIGLQRVYTAGRASSLYNRTAINGLLTNELIVLNVGNTGEAQLQTGGGSVDGTNTLLGGLWTSSNKILYDADRVLSGAAALGDKNYASGLIAYTTIFKALALGDLAMFWEKVPTSTGTGVSFADRTDGYNRAIAAIDAALSAVNANAISAAFLANIPTGIDIVNTLYALKARYSLFVGNYAQALTAANAVDLTKKSVFNFSTVNLNPIFETSTSTNNVYAIGDVNTLGLPAGLQPDPSDKRLPFYTTTAYASKIAGFGSGTVTPFPIYLPGEITLIKAEAYARQNDLTNALIELNKVITKQPSADPFGVGAGLPPLVGPLSQQQILDQIYKQRSIELFMSGLKLEDMRRFGRPTAERKRNFLPYPFQERDNNTNTPPDPPF
ncbi:RagB/SusD family nutrient uptake outer membrane protein [Flavisolibacter ginsenosidimutans]|uniref:RagB/SusD family nutrient uptake outer membrane protein n=1 Tax=Flavisolibacter ginsenosidimutans TaxID=661481 RepID=A0A5B8UGK0_9BACT|nr:RagB/SusD family nutrient uptake outer membrane protein [Flavisolibacter ginsenosidimutans]QEC55791.1 RagB/SusD family nutrient uptake outer membrane protein [Flavisolibacter ginsenosidimutans]